MEKPSGKGDRFFLLLNSKNLTTELFVHLQHDFCRDGLEDPLDDMGMVLQQLDQVSVIARCDYQKTCAMLVQVFDQTAALYQELINSSNTMPVDLNIQESTFSFWQPSKIMLVSFLFNLDLYYS